VREYLLTLILTAAVTYLLTPLVRRVAVATGAMHVGRERDVHTEPVPKLGGLAMYGGLAAGLLIASRISPLRTIFSGSRMAAGLLIAGGLLVIVGFVDDRWGLNVVSKLAGQVAAAGVLVWSGAQISCGSRGDPPVPACVCEVRAAAICAPGCSQTGTFTLDCGSPDDVARIPDLCLEAGCDPPPEPG
jgi:UDP-N-acetylmuramyl pentapeptide phosphotransferase/UDP-N-acetylglucosamine-1-phosphate transferase